MRGFVCLRAVAVTFVLLAAGLAGCVGSEDGGVAETGGAMRDPAGPERRSAFGTVEAAEPIGEGLVRLMMQAEAVNCERARETLDAEVLLQKNSTPPEAGAVLGVFLQEAPDGAWSLEETSPSMEQYAEACAGSHEGDLRSASPLRVEGSAAIPKSDEEVDAQDAYRAPIPIGGEVVLRGTLANWQDHEIAAQVANLTVIDYEAYRQSYPADDAPEQSRITGCTAKPQESEVVVPPHGEAPFRVVVSCSSGVSPVEDALLWGRLAFVDELGAEHAREKPFGPLTLGHATHLHVEAPERVDSPDEFRVSVAYTDPGGAPIAGASVHLMLDAPGAPNQWAPARYDEASRNYVFTWEDLRERAPREWPEGEQTVYVKAQAQGRSYVPNYGETVISFGE